MNCSNEYSCWKIKSCKISLLTIFKLSILSISIHFLTCFDYYTFLFGLESTKSNKSFIWAAVKTLLFPLDNFYPGIFYDLAAFFNLSGKGTSTTDVIGELVSVLAVLVVSDKSISVLF